MMIRCANSLIISLALLLQGIGGTGGVGGKGGVGGAKGIPTPTIRGTSAVFTPTTGTSGLFITLPTSSAAGDLDLFFCNGNFNINTLAGWTQLALDNGNTWNMYVAYKVLSSGDITTGQFFCNMAGSGGIAGAMVGFVGGTSGVRESEDSGPLNSATTHTLTTSSGVLSTDTGIYWSSNRQTGATGSIVPGSGVLTTYQTLISPTTGAPSNSILGGQFMAGGVQANVFNQTSGGNWEAIQVIVETP